MEETNYKGSNKTYVGRWVVIAISPYKDLGRAFNRHSIYCFLETALKSNYFSGFGVLKKLRNFVTNRSKNI